MEDGRNGVHVQNATYKRVVDAAECTNVFRQGWSNRAMGQTDFETLDHLHPVCATVKFQK